MKYLVNAFSPAMLSGSCNLQYKEITRIEFAMYATECKVVISHEVTANLLSQIVGFEVKANRVNLKVNPGDILLGFTPGFRCAEAREFTREEIENSPHKFWILEIHKEVTNE